jgi:hypothetical protein
VPFRETLLTLGWTFLATLRPLVATALALFVLSTVFIYFLPPFFAVLPAIFLGCTLATALPLGAAALALGAAVRPLAVFAIVFILYHLLSSNVEHECIHSVSRLCLPVLLFTHEFPSQMCICVTDGSQAMFERVARLDKLCEAQSQLGSCKHSR